MRRFSRLLSLLDRRRASKYHSDPSEGVAVCCGVPDDGFHDSYIDALAAEWDRVTARIRGDDLAGIIASGARLPFEPISWGLAARGEYVPPTAAAREAIAEVFWAVIDARDGGFRVRIPHDVIHALHERGYVIVPTPVDRWADLADSPGGTD